MKKIKKMKNKIIKKLKIVLKKKTMKSQKIRIKLKKKKILKKMKIKMMKKITI